MLLVSLDIETACALGCEEKCTHALDEYRNRITVVGLFYTRDGKPHAHTFRRLDNLRTHLNSLGPHQFVAHNGKFDFRVLAAHGLDLSAHWAEDTQLMAATLTTKIPNDWMEWYERQRRIRNSGLPRGFSHRTGSPHSLKCLAPYHLRVEPFWENPADHDNDEYVLRDCEYTYRLMHHLEGLLKAEGSYDFYKTKLLPWTKMLLAMERRGVALDFEAMSSSEREAHHNALEARATLDRLWAPAYAEFRRLRLEELQASYRLKGEEAVGKLKNKTAAKAEATRARYRALYEKAAEKVPTQCNLDSPVQLSWILRDFYKLDISDFHGEETTGKAVLNRLGETREDIRVFLEYRKNQKLVSAFFPSYREMQFQGTLHCSFNPTGTRTGRLSSSGPNLQQVPGHLHKLFRARPGYKLATYDMSAIEPRLIAYYTHDLNLFDIVASGADFHGNNARIFFGLDCELSEVKERFPQERKMAKEVGLSLFYGAGSGRLEETALKYGFRWGPRQCQEVLKRFKEEYEGVYKFRDDFLNPALMSGHAVTNLLGRQFRIDDPTDVHMQGLNTMVQGSASDLVINSAERIMRAFAERGIDGHVLLLVHDEIVTEIPAARESECVQVITEAMTDYELKTPLGRVPLLVEGKVADRWEK